MRKFNVFWAILLLALIFGLILLFARFLIPARVYGVQSPQIVPHAESEPAEGILATADRLFHEYGYRPPYNGKIFAPDERLTPEQAIYAIPYVIDCESGDRSVKIVDSNGYYSYGILQFQSSTWAGFVKASGITGDPMVKADAVRMALWAFENGYIQKWSCASIERVIHT